MPAATTEELLDDAATLELLEEATLELLDCALELALVAELEVALAATLELLDTAFALAPEPSLPPQAASSSVAINDVAAAAL